MAALATAWDELERHGRTGLHDCASRSRLTVCARLCAVRCFTQLTRAQLAPGQEAGRRKPSKVQSFSRYTPTELERAT